MWRGLQFEIELTLTNPNYQKQSKNFINHFYVKLNCNWIKISLKIYFSALCIPETVHVLPLHNFFVKKFLLKVNLVSQIWPKQIWLTGIWIFSESIKIVWTTVLLITINWKFFPVNYQFSLLVCDTKQLRKLKWWLNY